MARVAGKAWDGNGWLVLSERPDAPRPHPPRSNSWEQSDSTIYIGVSSFRDWRCPRTLFNYFSKAKYPERVRVGLVQQNDSQEDPDCVRGYCDLMAEAGLTENGKCPHREHIRVMRISFQEAAGPCYGRHLQAYMLRDEEFCMQTDSHMDVIKYWDVEMLKSWGRAENEYGILTTYVARMSDVPGEGQPQPSHVPHLCQVTFTSEGNPRYDVAKLAVELKKPKLTVAWAAGFSFARCHAWHAVPYDPELKFVFDGEEFSMAARLWTRGYDFYTPDLVLIGHDYEGIKNKDWKGARPGSWTANNQASRRKESYARLRTLLKLRGEYDEGVAEKIGVKYGLGTVRSKQDFERFVGVNLESLEQITNRCGSIEWMPFDDPLLAGSRENNMVGQYWEMRKITQALPDPNTLLSYDLTKKNNVENKDPLGTPTIGEETKAEPGHDNFVFLVCLTMAIFLGALACISFGNCLYRSRKLPKAKNVEDSV